MLPMAQGNIKKFKKYNCIVNSIFLIEESFFLGCRLYISYLRNKLVVIQNLTQLVTTSIR